jgi:hypothetical protein
MLRFRGESGVVEETTPVSMTNRTLRDGVTHERLSSQQLGTEQHIVDAIKQGGFHNETAMHDWFCCNWLPAIHCRLHVLHHAPF